MTIVATAAAANADSYATLADADAYFSARGVATWTGLDAAKEAALRVGTSYLDNAYRDRWIGIRYTQEQALAWPRVDGAALGGIFGSLYDTDGYPIAYDAIPVQVQRAAMEAALLALTGTTLEPSLARGGAIKSIGKGVGPLRKDITYADGAPVIDRYTAIEGLLRGLVRSIPGATSGMVTLVRA